MLVYYYFKKHDLIHYSFMKQDVFSGVEMTHDISKSLLRMLFYSAVHTLAGFLLDSQSIMFFWPRDASSIRKVLEVCMILIVIHNYST